MEKYQDSTISPEERAMDLLSQMSLEEKVSQLVGYNPASWSKDDLDRDYPLGAGQVSFLMGGEESTIYEAAAFQRDIQEKIMEKSPHHIPAIFHGEALCGAMLPGAVSFPSGIGQGATFDPKHQRKVGERIGKQIRLAGASQAFAPVLDISRDPRFGRQGETYGEDPALAAAMGSAYVQGMQQDGDLKEGVIATAKHFLGYHDSQGGIHAAACDIPERLLREIYGKPFQAAITQAQMKGIMPCYGSINGEPVSGSAQILTKLLQEEMGFDGLVVSDYCAVQEIHERQGVCESYAEAGAKALLAGIHQELPSQKCFTSAVLSQDETGEVAKALDRAVCKVLTAKFALGLFEQPFAASVEAIREVYENQKEENRKLALQSALESFVLVKNDGTLPLTKEKKKIALIGYHGNMVRSLFGGYTYVSVMETALGAKNTMAGLEMVQEEAESPCYEGTVVEWDHPEAEAAVRRYLGDVPSLLEELQQRVPEIEVTYSYGYDYTGRNCDHHEEALKAAQDADCLLLCVGGKYGTGSTASMGEGIDGTDVNLPFCQETFLKKAAALDKPMILLHFGGRPISSDSADQYANAILEVWNPGEEGAAAIVSTLFGEYNPGGRMPISTPYQAGQIPLYYNHPNGSAYHQNTISAFRQYMDCPHEPRYFFGHGLSYTTFTYHDLQVPAQQVDPNEEVLVSLQVTNSGLRDGEEVVQLYVKDCFASMVRPVMELAGFSRVFLKVGETKQLTFRMKVSQFAFLDENMRWKAEAGEMTVMAGASAGDIRLTGTFHITRSAVVDGRTRGFYAEVEETSV